MRSSLTRPLTWTWLLIELKRVTWPTRPEVVQATQATLIFVVLTAVFLLVADTTLGALIDFLIVG